MIDTRKIRFFQEKMLDWSSISGRKFYWRKKGLPTYHYIIAEVLLQRTKAETIAKFYPGFVRQFPNWRSLAKAKISDIEDYLRPVGLYTQRANRVKNSMAFITLGII